MILQKVFIILVNYNGVSDTLECLKSLKKIDYPNYKVIVVDNNSSGNDIEVIKKEYSDFIDKIIIAESNLGFSGGNNLGINYALENKADFILLLNNDTVVRQDFLSVMINKSKEYPDVGIVTCRINYFDKKDVSWYSGGHISKIKASGFDLNLPNNSKDTFCSFASGCNLLIKREVIEKVGLLDGKYFLYLEDTDYCARTIKAGYKILFTDGTKIFHKVCSTTGRDSNLLPLYYSTRNRFYFIKKNYPVWRVISYIYLFLAFSIKYVMSSNKKEYFTVVSKAFLDFYSGRLGKTNYFDRG
ncbi:MAG: glycosyltransferase family 2 protein [Melioribacteraceae bacterium]